MKNTMFLIGLRPKGLQDTHAFEYEVCPLRSPLRLPTQIRRDSSMRPRSRSMSRRLCSMRVSKQIPTSIGAMLKAHGPQKLFRLPVAFQGSSRRFFYQQDPQFGSFMRVDLAASGNSIHFWPLLHPRDPQKRYCASALQPEGPNEP